MARIALVVLALALCICAAAAGAGDPASTAAKARELIGRGDYAQALEELEDAHSLFPYDIPLKRSLALTYSELGKRDLDAGRHRRAAERFAQARDLFPEQKDFVLLRGIAFYLGKDYPAARSELKQVGEAVEAFLYLGKIAYDTGDLNGALSLWRRAREKDPDNKILAGLIQKAERELPVEARMDRGYSSMFDLSFDAELPPGLSAEVLDALEAAYGSVGADLGLFPSARVPVLLYTRKDYSSVTTGPDWSAGLYDGKIRLPVGGVTKITPQMRAILFHEYAHVLVFEMTRGNIPTWLNEGIAEIQGRKEFAPAPRLSSGNDAKLLPLSTLSGSFGSMAGEEAQLAYRQSHSMVEFLVSRYGWYPVQQILKRLGEQDGIEQAVAKGLSDWSLDLPGLLREWRESVAAAAE